MVIYLNDDLLWITQSHCHNHHFGDDVCRQVQAGGDFHGEILWDLDLSSDKITTMAKYNPQKLVELHQNEETICFYP